MFKLDLLKLPIGNGGIGIPDGMKVCRFFIYRGEVIFKMVLWHCIFHLGLWEFFMRAVWAFQSPLSTKWDALELEVGTENPAHRGWDFRGRAKPSLAIAWEICIERNNSVPRGNVHQ